MQLDLKTRAVLQMTKKKEKIAKLPLFWSPTTRSQQWMARCFSSSHHKHAWLFHYLQLDQARSPIKRLRTLRSSSRGIGDPHWKRKQTAQVGRLWLQHHSEGRFIFRCGGSFLKVVSDSSINYFCLYDSLLSHKTIFIWRINLALHVSVVLTVKFFSII